MSKTLPRPLKNALGVGKKKHKLVQSDYLVIKFGNSPVAQFLQLVRETAPADAEYVPEAQFTQLVAPREDENVPAEHAVQSDEAAPASVEYVPLTQLVQEYMPMFENVPAAQVLHVGPAPAETAL